VSDRLKKLIPTLLERTTAGEMKWESLTSDDSFVHLLKGGGALILSRSDNKYSLRLLNPSLTEVDNEEDDQEAGELATLMAFLKRNALKVDDTFENLEKELGI
jgi:hypothetical protein